MITVEGGVNILTMDLISLMINKGRDVDTITAIATAMIVVKQDKINTRFTMGRHCEK